MCNQQWFLTLIEFTSFPTPSPSLSFPFYPTRNSIRSKCLTPSWLWMTRVRTSMVRSHKEQINSVLRCSTQNNKQNVSEIFSGYPHFVEWISVYWFLQFRSKLRYQTPERMLIIQYNRLLSWRQNQSKYRCHESRLGFVFFMSRLQITYSFIQYLIIYLYTYFINYLLI